MSDHLCSLGYQVLGWGRHGLENGKDLAAGSICDPAAVTAVLQQWKPDEIYHFAAHHHSSEQARGDDLQLFQRCIDVNLMSLVHVLHAVKERSPLTRVFYAASSRIFGAHAPVIASEETPVTPTCPYGITKTAGLHACQHYRRHHALHVSVGILFNHESALRPAHYLSKKIVQAVIDIRRGAKGGLSLGSLTAGADWGYAPDTITKIHQMVQLPAGHDFIIATGEGHTVEEFASLAFAQVGLNWRDHVHVDTCLVKEVRPILIGDPARFRQACGSGHDRSFQELIRQLIIDAGGTEFLI